MCIKMSGCMTREKHPWYINLRSIRSQNQIFNSPYCFIAALKLFLKKWFFYNTGSSPPKVYFSHLDQRFHIAFIVNVTRWDKKNHLLGLAKLCHKQFPRTVAGSLQQLHSWRCVWKVRQGYPEYTPEIGLAWVRWRGEPELDERS